MIHREIHAYILCLITSISAKFIWDCLCPEAILLMPIPKQKIIGQMRGKIHVGTATYLWRYHLLYGAMPFSSSCTSVSLAAGATASQFIKVPATAETRWSCARRGSTLCWQTGCQGRLPSSSASRIKCKSQDSVPSLARDGEWTWDTLSQQETGAQVHWRGHLVAGLARTCRKVGDEKRAGIFPAEMPA